MVQFIVSIVGGSALGCIYALVALGMVLAYRATNTFNFSHGQFMLLPAFIVGAWTSSHTVPLWFAVVFAIALTAGIGALFYLLVLQRTTGLPPFMGVIATFGLAIMIDGGMLLVFPESQYGIEMPGISAGSTSILGARVATSSLQLSAFMLALAAGIILVLRFTSVGRRLRVAGQDPILASQGGINVRLLHLASWAVAGGLAAVAGIAYGSTHLVDGTLTALMLAAFPAILIGGLDSIGGAIVGGLAVGIFQGFVATYFSPATIDVATYSLVLGVMLVIPQGLWGTRSVTRV